MDSSSSRAAESAANSICRLLHAGKPAWRGCTIVAQNYLAQAEILVRSFRRHHPGCAFSILVIDDFDRSVRRHDDVEILSLADIGLDPGDELRMPMIYDVTELSTAVKPWLLRKLHDEETDAVIYFDPDIEIFSPLHDLAELARKHSIVLTPHVTEPIPQDKLQLSESDILGSGIYNLGFIAIGPGSEDFLSWWAARLRRECVIDPSRMRFTDQRWIDFVPGLFRHYIVQDPGFNVAYWNLHSRKVVREGDDYLVNGRPLRFFHFSGYNPTFPHILSKHQGDQPRVLLSEHPGVRRLCKDYRRQLVEAGFDSANKTPYGFAHLSNGLKLDDRLRRIYRRALKESENDGTAEPPSPFAPEGETLFLDWLNEPMTTGPRAVTRFMLAIHAERDDLRSAFPDPLGADAAAFYAWFVREGYLQAQVHPALIPGADLSARTSVELPVAVAEKSDAPVVNVAGYFRAELGIGEAARLLIMGLHAAGVPYRTISHTETINRQNHPFQEQIGDGQADINIICVNADQTPAFGARMGPDFYRDRYTIGVWFWEIEDFPAAFQSAFDYVDEVWVATEFVRQALIKVSPKPVYKFPLPLVRSQVIADSSNRSPETGARFTFLFSFDFMSVFERKNPIGVITAFKRAFKPGEGPTLLIKSINGDKKILELERVKLAAVSRPDIIVSDGYISAAEKDAMMARCDCYVSLHRSEGYGLTLAEAMSLGKPAIATGYSGNLEFMTENNSYLCPFDFRQIGPGAAPYSPDSRWAEPNLDEAAQLMRRVFEQQEEAKAKGLRAAEDIRMLHAPEIAGGAISDRLATIRARRNRFGRITPLEVLERRLEALEAAPRTLLRISTEETARVTRAENAIRALGSDLESLSSGLASKSESLAELASTQDSIKRGLEKRIEALEAVARTTEANDFRGRAIEEGQERMQRRLEDIVAQMEAVPFMSNPAAFRAENVDGGETIGYRSAKHGNNGSDLYISFENVFRGSEEMIRERQRFYLDVLSSHAPVVDLGCGRGEMLDLLRDAGVSAVGVDLDPGMISHVRNKGHEVVQQSALDYLAGQPPGSIGAIFCAQVIEHMSYEDLLTLLKLGRSRLKEGAPLILETVNPHSHRALKTFWVDLTHNKPIFPEVLVALCRESGYAEAIVRFPCGKGELEHDRLWEGEYAVIARNGAAVTEPMVKPARRKGKRTSQMKAIKAVAD